MPMPTPFRDRLELPVIGAPMFIVSGTRLVIEQCRAGIVGTMPSLNAREPGQFGPMLDEIESALAESAAADPSARIAPYGINLIVHKTNRRLQHDLEVCVQHRVPLIITSLGASRAIVEVVHGYGGIVMHDITNMRHARKAIGEGVDGIIAVCAGAGGHAGTLSPVALVRELRQEFPGIIALSGAISDGHGILAALAIGADLAYLGSRFIATTESLAHPDYKHMIVEGNASDIVYTSAMTGVNANYLRPSMVRSGIDPEKLEARDNSTMSFAEGSPRPKAWKDVWGCGQGLGIIHDVPSTRDLVTQLKSQVLAAKRELDERLAGVARA